MRRSQSDVSQMGVSANIEGTASANNLDSSIDITQDLLSKSGSTAMDQSSVTEDMRSVTRSPVKNSNGINQSVKMEDKSDIDDLTSDVSALMSKPGDALNFAANLLKTLSNSKMSQEIQSTQRSIHIPNDLNRFVLFDFPYFF